MPATSELAAALKADVLARFDRYARIDTQSARGTGTVPSTAKQLDLSRLLVEELLALGLSDAALSDEGCVYATLPASPGLEDAPVVALIAHVDTSPDASGTGVEPIVHAGYDGGRIALPRGGTVLDPAAMPELRAKVGHDLVTSSGDTLLGADDKAGVAEVMAAIAYLAGHPELPRPTLRAVFTTDEEIGSGAQHVDLDRVAAYCAYTLDGSEVGELQAETFTAAEAVLTITGVDVHPGFATGRMVNALRLAGRVLAELPAGLAPETTSDRQGFVHPHHVAGDAGQATITCIVRDFEDDLLARHVEVLRATAARVVDGSGGSFALDVTPQYPNMRAHLEPFPEVVEHALEAIRREGLEPRQTVIRGGTDGSILSARGLPTPNVFTGGHEFHSVREWASVDDMASAAAVVVRLAGVWAEAPVVAR